MAARGKWWSFSRKSGPSPPARETQDKPKVQFSKKQVIFSDVLVVAVWLGEIILHWFERQGVGDVAIAIITAYGAFATGGYFTLAGTRDCSLNKHVHGKKMKEDNES